MPRDKRVDHRRLQRRMMGIVVSPAAYAAIVTNLTGVDVERERAPNGDYCVWLEPAVVDRIAALRGPGESYNDVIVRLAAG